MIFNATSGKNSLNNISVYDRVADVNAIGGRYFRIAGTNKVFDVKSILTKKSTNEGKTESDAESAATASPQISGEEKFGKKQEILEEDILPEVWIDDKEDLRGYKKNLLDLINGKSLTSGKIRIIHEGKVVELEPALYNRQGYSGEEGAEEQQYYQTEDGKFLKKEKITPPAFKQLSQEEAKELIDRNGLSIYDGAFRRFDAVKFLDDENKAHYVRNAKIKYQFNEDTNAYDAVIKYNVAVDDTHYEVKTQVIKSVSKEVETEVKIENGLSTTLTNVVRYSNDRYKKYDENGREVEYRFKLDKSPRHITTKLNKGMPDTDIHFVEGKSEEHNTIPVKKITKSFYQTPHSKYGKLQIAIKLENENQLVKENNKIVGIKNLYTNQVINLSTFPFEFKINVERKTEQQFDYNKVAVYKESNLFKTKNGKSVLEADLIQTSAIGLDGEFSAYDYGERSRVFAEFERNIEELKSLSNQGINSQSDLERITNLQKIIDGQLNKLGDLETAKVIEEKRKKLEEEKSKTGNDRDESKIANAQKEYEEALKNVGFYKDKNNLATIDDLIRQYQQGEFFNTFYFDKNGNKVEINSGDLTTITSNLPFEWSKSKTVESIIGKDKVAFNKTTGKAQIGMSSGAKEVAVASAKIAGVALNLSFTGGPISLLFMPLGVTIATVCITVSGVTAVGEIIRTKVKQAKLNSMTPQKLKDRQDIEIQKSMEKEFKNALKQYKEDLAHVDRNFTTDKDREKLRREAENKFRETRKAIYRQYMLAASGNITSKFNNKNKKITNENLYGFLEYRRRMKESKHRKALDLDVEERIEGVKLQYKKDLNTAKVLYKDNPKILADKKKQLKVHLNDAKNEYLSEFGPLRLRLWYLKKTEKYFKATKEERKNLVKECQEKCKNDMKNIVVENVSLKSDDVRLESYRLRALSLAKLYAPSKSVNGNPYNDESKLVRDDLKVPISISSEENHIDKSHDDNELDEMQEVVSEYTKVSEKCKEIANENNEEKASHAVVELYNEQEKVQERLRDVLKDDDLIKKVLEDTALWKNQKDKPDARQLEEFVKKLEVQTDKNKFLAQQYGRMLTEKIQQKIKDWKEEFKEDDEALKMFEEENFKRIQKSLSSKSLKSRYGVEASVNEKIMRLFEDAESQGEKKRDYLVKIHKKLEKEELEKIKKEELARIEKEKLAKKQKRISTAIKWSFDATDTQFKKYKNEIEIIQHYKDYSEKEVEKALNTIQKVVELYEAFNKKGGREV